MVTPTIESERIVLKPLTVSDAEDIFKRWTQDERVARYVRWFPHDSVEVTKQWLTEEVKNNLGGASYQWGFWLKETNYIFGSGGLVYNEEENLFEIGYNIMHKYWNKGYTTEAVKRMLQFGQEELHQNEFVAWYAKENPASGRILEKCGFIFERDDIATKFDGVTKMEENFMRLQLGK